MKDKTTGSVIKSLQKILAEARNCQYILSDNGAEFTLQELASFLESQGIKHQFTAPYSPQSNGVLERWHRFMNNVVCLCDPIRMNNEWEGAVLAALKAYHSIPHAATGESPYFLCHKQDPVLHLDKLLPIILRNFNHDDSTAAKVTQQIQAAFGLARKNVCLSRLRNKPCSVKQPESPLKVGDMVTI